MKKKTQGLKVRGNQITLIDNKVGLIVIEGYGFTFNNRKVIVHRSGSQWTATHAQTGMQLTDNAKTKKAAIEYVKTKCEETSDADFAKMLAECFKLYGKLIAKIQYTGFGNDTEEVTETKPEPKKTTKKVAKSKKGGDNMTFKKRVTTKVNELIDGCDITDVGYIRRRSIVLLDVNAELKEYNVTNVWTHGICALASEEDMVYKALWEAITWIAVKVKNRKTGEDEWIKKPIDTPHIHARWMAHVEEMDALGYYPAPWHSANLTTEDGKLRIHPFFKKGFDMNSFLTEITGADYSELFTMDNLAKTMKYLASPWSLVNTMVKTDDDGNRTIKMGTIPFFKALCIPEGFEGFNSDGTIYVADSIKDYEPGVMHFRGPGIDKHGRGSWGKGTAVLNCDIRNYMKDDTYAAVVKEAQARLTKAEFEYWVKHPSIVNAGSFKGAADWTVVEFCLFEHGNSVRAIRKTFNLSSQFVMYNPMTEYCIEHIRETMMYRDSETTNVMNSDRISEATGDWVNRTVFDKSASDTNKRDFANLASGDLGKLLKITNMPRAIGYNKNTKPEFRAARTMLHRLRKSMGTYFRYRTAGSIPFDGTLALVVYNQRLDTDCMKPSVEFMRMHKKHVNDVLTTIKSPVGPMSPRNRRIVGIAPKTGKGVWFEISNHYGFDTDGDRMSVSTELLMKYNVELLEKHEVKDKEGNVIAVRNFKEEYNIACVNIDEMINEFSTPIEPTTDYNTAVENSMRVLEASRGVNYVENMRKQIAIISGMSENWPLIQAIFEKVSEGILIKGMKHNVPVIFDYVAFVEDMCDKYGLFTPNAMALINSKKTSEKTIAGHIEDPELDLIGHRRADIYERGFNMAVKINDLFTINKDDIEYLDLFKKGLKAGYNAMLDGLMEDDPDMYHELVTNYVNTDLSHKGDAERAYNIMKKFYDSNKYHRAKMTQADFAFLMDMTPKEVLDTPEYAEFYALDGFKMKMSENPNASRIKAIYREIEQGWFDRLTPHQTSAMICGTLEWGVYAWMYNYKAEDIRTIVEGVEDIIS